MFPKVSVVIPTYNRRVLVKKAIDSVLAQTFADIEVIVADDGSTDGTGEELTKCYGERINYIWQMDQGASAARNRGLASAQGEYVALLDSDDYWFSDKLSKQVALMDANPDAVLVITQSWLIDSRGERLPVPPFCSTLDEQSLTFESLCLDNHLEAASSTALIRHSTLRQIGGFDPSLRFGEDWDLWLRLRRQGRFAFIPEPLACVRFHAESHTQCDAQERIDTALSDHLRLADKAIASWSNDIPVGMRERILARHYGRIAFVSYALDKSLKGQALLQKAIDLDPAHWSDPQRIADRLVQVMLHHSLVHSSTVQDIIGRTMASFEHLPAMVNLPKQRRARILGRIYAGMGFASYRQRDSVKTRYCMIRAIQMDRVWLWNRGVWSVLSKSLLGFPSSTKGCGQCAG